jgi:hypothetical protein
MRSRLHRLSSVRPAKAPLAWLLLIAAGACLLFLPPLLRKQQRIASTAASPSLFALPGFAVEPGQQACMESVTLGPHGDVVEFWLAAAGAPGAPPVEAVLSAPGYLTRAYLAGGHPPGAALLPIAPPPHEQIGLVCLLNRGSSPLQLLGSQEARSFSRAQLVIAGRAVVGEIGLALLDGRPRSLLDRLDEAFAHASNLTDRLVPAWLIWLVAVLVTLGVPLAMVAAFYRAITEEAAAHTQTPLSGDAAPR